MQVAIREAEHSVEHAFFYRVSRWQRQCLEVLKVRQQLLSGHICHFDVFSAFFSLTVSCFAPIIFLCWDNQASICAKLGVANL